MDARFSWTSEESELLKKIYSFLPRQEILQQLPKHSWTAIRIYARKLGLSRKEWIGKYEHHPSPKHTEVLKKLWKNTEYREKMIAIQKRVKFGYRKMEEHPMWKGGRRRTGINGYMRVKVFGHPNADDQGYILEHRLVMEKFIGRKLTKKEQVHHKNGIKSDNRIENLEIRYALPHDGEVTCPYCNKTFGVAG